MRHPAFWCLLVGMGFSACSARRERPPGPPPEYERPQVMEWDAGKPIDPFNQVEGEEVTDDEPVDAGQSEAGDAAPLAPPAEP
ncbi:MAG: hypothetical protein IPI67_19060 [Myxococcales bacterium]|nr:hypothetical protein [Myxococcales bacterium]